MVTIPPARADDLSELPEPLLTSAELAAWLQVTDRTLRRWRKEGRITAIMVGRTVRFRLSDLLSDPNQSKR